MLRDGPLPAATASDLPRCAGEVTCAHTHNGKDHHCDDYPILHTDIRSTSGLRSKHLPTQKPMISVLNTRSHIQIPAIMATTTDPIRNTTQR